MGGYIGEHYRDCEGETRSLDNGSRVQSNPHSSLKPPVLLPPPTAWFARDSDREGSSAFSKGSPHLGPLRGTHEKRLPADLHPG